MALRLQQVAEIQDLLRRTPGLVDRLEDRAPDYVDRVVEWLKAGETVLEQNRLHSVSVVASLRASVTSALRGIDRDESTSSRRGMSRRRRAEAQAVKAMQEGITVLRGVIEARCDDIEEATKIARQILSIAALKGLVEPCSREIDARARLACLEAAIRSDADLLPYLAALKGLVAHHDALALLDQASSEVLSGGPGA